jgi:hypothetical protein
MLAGSVSAHPDAQEYETIVGLDLRRSAADRRALIGPTVGRVEIAGPVAAQLPAAERRCALIRPFVGRVEVTPAITAELPAAACLRCRSCHANGQHQQAHQQS